MENRTLSGLVPGFGVSFLVVSLLNALLVAAKELNPALLAWMKALTGHHWITHGVIVLASFYLLGLILSRLDLGEGLNGSRAAALVAAGVIVGGGSIGLFFLMHG
jgi:hypothetical protein